MTGRSGAWDAFTSSLAAVLGVLDEDQYLILECKDGPWFVQFAGGGAHGLRAEMVSNTFLPAEHRISTESMSRALDLGWLSPTGGTESDPTTDPDGSPNHFREWDPPVPFLEVSSLAIETLIAVLHVTHPSNLRYRSFDRQGSRILLPTLRLQETPRDSGPPATEEIDVPATVLDIVRAMTGRDDLSRDQDGDVPLGYRDSVVFVRVFGQPPLVRIFSPVVEDLDASPALHQAVAELNRQAELVRWLVDGNAVVVLLDLFGEPLTPQHLVEGCRVIGEVASTTQDRLQAEFGGRTFFGGFSPPKANHPETGGYL